MYQLTEEQIEKAVDWWASAIEHPKFDGLSQEERRDPKNDSYQLGEMMATVASKTKTSEQIEKFKLALASLLSSDNFNPYHGLHVDYGPDMTLASAASAAGIDTSITSFPWKTNMWFNDEGNVDVRAGYGAKVEKLLEEPND